MVVYLCARRHMPRVCSSIAARAMSSEAKGFDATAARVCIALPAGGSNVPGLVRVVNAGAKMRRFAGAKLHQGCKQKALELGPFFTWHQAWVGLSSGVSELARRDRRLL